MLFLVCYLLVIRLFSAYNYCDFFVMLTTVFVFSKRHRVAASLFNLQHKLYFEETRTWSVMKVFFSYFLRTRQVHSSSSFIECESSAPSSHNLMGTTLKGGNLISTNKYFKKNKIPHIFLSRLICKYVQKPNWYFSISKVNVNYSYIYWNFYWINV